MKNISLSLKERQRMDIFLYLGKSKTRLKKNWANANWNKFIKTCMEKYLEIETPTLKKMSISQ